MFSPALSVAIERIRPRALAIVANAATPYRIHLHRRIAAEIPELDLHSIFTHNAGEAEAAWRLDVPDEIRPAWFGIPGERLGESIARRPWADWRKGQRIANHLFRIGAVAVIVHGYNYLAFLRVIGACHRAGIPVFLRGDSNDRADHHRQGCRGYVKRRLLQWLIEHTDGIMPVGALGEAYFRRYGADPKRIFRVTFEPDYALFGHADLAAVSRFRQQHHFPADNRAVLFSGRLMPYKRVDLLIDAWAEVFKHRPGWRLLVVGEGPERQKLESRIPVASRQSIYFLGFLQPEDMRLAYATSSVAVVPSDYEPWGLVVNEAMAAGLAVVASDVVGAAYDLVRDGINGRIFPKGDLASLIQALLDVTDSDQLPRLRAASSLILSAWRHDWDAVTHLRRALAAVGVLQGININPTNVAAVS